ncbi:MAG: UDP-N-acetylmuramate--L-alanine ligase [Sulfobacillus sp.]
MSRYGGRVHFVGVGGISMSALAHYLYLAGELVSGSDARASARTDRLAQAGIPVTIGHDAALQEGAAVVVYSTDVPADNPELTAARARGARLAHRSEILTEVLEGRRLIAVTGTHGKTTTTTLIGYLLEQCGFDPLVFTGGEVEGWLGGLRPGQGQWAVVEGDESDRSILRLTPEVVVVTNLEPEHLEHYVGDFSRLQAAVRQFVSSVQEGGSAVLCAEDDLVAALAVPVGVRRFTYGRGAEMAAVGLRATAQGQAFDLHWRGESQGRVHSPLSGRHNMLNTLAAVAACVAAGVEPLRLAPVMTGFCNAHRRLEVLYQGDGVRLVDDYAVHPTEIRVVLETLRSWRPKRLIAALQPHRYERLGRLFADFVQAVGAADEVWVFDVYGPLGAHQVPGVSGQDLATAIGHSHPLPVRYLADVSRLGQMAAELRRGDLLVALGAGDISHWAHQLAVRLASAQGPQN